MKKVLTLALCLGAVASMSAQKTAVDAAKKLTGKLDKIEEARSTIKGALTNPETANDPNTFFVAGNIEFEAFDKANTKAQTDKNYQADNDAMGQQLLNGFTFFDQALRMEGQPGAKQKNSGKMLGILIKRVSDYWNAGANYFNDKKFDKAYEAFWDFGEIASLPQALVPDSTVATSYQNAGIAAYSANMLPQAILAFKQARATNATTPESYIYEIACWQNLAQKDSTLSAQASDEIFGIASEGLTKYGTSQPVFLNNVVNCLLDKGEIAQAIKMADDVIASDPDNGNVYGLRAFVNERNNNIGGAEADYRKALTLADTDYDTLKNASIFLFKRGTEMLNELEGNSPEVRAKKQELKNNYFMPASEAASRAKKLNANDSRLDSIIDSIDYAIATYFN